jgi:uncharacterized delta-60 repeat protein
MRSGKTSIGAILALGLILGLAFGLTRGVSYAADGDLDPSFSGDGLVNTNFYNTEDEARAVAIQADGKIVAVGTTHIGGTNYDFSVARYNPNGSLDNSFDGDGRITTNFWCTLYCESDDGAYAVAIQPDGKIVVAGSAEWRDAYSFAVARYNTDGSLDGTFGPGPYGVYGIKIVIFGDFYSDVSVAHGVAIQGDGKIVLAGRSTNGGGSTNFALARLNPDGSLDTTFDGDGMLTTNFFGGVDEGHAVAIYGSTILVAGFAQVSGFNYDFALARYNPNGSFDTTFDGDGKVTTDFFGGDDGALSMALQPDGKIVAAGAFYSTGQGYDFGLARYLSNGALDTGFDNDGLQDINFVGGNGTEVALGVAVQPGDSKIVAVGYAPVGGINDFALVRLNPDGSPDSTFGTGGKVNHDFGGGVAIGYGVAVQADGRIVSAGTAYMDDLRLYDFALARYLSGDGGTPTPTPTNTPTGQPTATATPSRTPSPTPCPINFTDVQQSDYFYTPVQYLYCRGVISGYGSVPPCDAGGTPCFKPYNNTIRGQMSKIVVLGFGIPLSNTATPHFSDVPASNPFFVHIQTGAEWGIVSGYADGTFRPFNNVTRGQLSKIVVAAANIALGWGVINPANPSFSDVPRTNPFYTFIETAACHGIISGYSDGTFRWGNDATRGQIAKIVYLAILNQGTCVSRSAGK